MNNNLKNDPTVAVDSGGEVQQGFNRTVTVAVAPNVTVVNGGRQPSGGRKSPNQKREIEDFIKGVNINPFISSHLDMSSNLNGDLDNIKESYAMLEEFADGGTASVFSARDRKLSRLVAVKSLKLGDGDNTDSVNAFVTEAKVTAQLDHPGIIPIYGLFTDDKNGIHLVMKLVNGKTLREYLHNITLNYRTRGIDAFD